MSPTTAELLVGGWQLDSYLTEDDGGFREGPLGPAPRGLLIYSADGRVSVSMMRTDGPPAGPGRFMGYAGSWHIVEDDGAPGTRVVHDVAVSSHPYMVGSRQLRDLTLTGDVLTLAGSAGAAGGPSERRVLTWSRTTGGTA
ncbi:lipocalin-like domain-containing protein [Kitasatospora sp. NPDC059146]|uniref:lipocalin-like domain-containing protein n=1 Tax=Kitasatospora sp. NPDC059146 TaxID=3346741 RepID=UPI0036784D21